MAVGKPISLSTHSFPQSSDSNAPDLGTADIGGLDVISELQKNRWVKVRDLKCKPADDDAQKRDLETEAKAAGLGIWNPHGPQARVAHRWMPQDSQAFVSEWKGKLIDGMFLRHHDLIIN